MTNREEAQLEPRVKKGFSGVQVLWLVAGSVCLAVIATFFTIKVFLFPGPFKPVVLSAKEEQQLATKLDVFEGFVGRDQQTQSQQAQKDEKSEHDSDGSLTPEKYSEEGASRDIAFTERELNALIARNTDLADKLAIDLADSMVSIKLLIPLDPEFPMLGGKILKVKAGAELAYRESRPVVILKGVSLMGVPMPNAWLGGLKNIDLVKEFGADEGFWKTFSDGVDSISVVEGFLQIRLKE